jgi:hypothetical protein
MKKALIILAGALLAIVPLITVEIASAYGGSGVSAKPVSMSPVPSSFQRCPWPRTCMAPCLMDAPVQVLCRTPGGKMQRTSFACCCCGSGLNSYKPLPAKG